MCKIFKAWRFTWYLVKKNILSRLCILLFLGISFSNLLQRSSLCPFKYFSSKSFRIWQLLLHRYIAFHWEIHWQLLETVSRMQLNDEQTTNSSSTSQSSISDVLQNTGSYKSFEIRDNAVYIRSQDVSLGLFLFLSAVKLHLLFL